MFKAIRFNEIAKRLNKTASSNSSSQKVRWHTFGMGRESQRDQAALTFARLGLLASRW